jgi:hypothetical protein
METEKMTVIQYKFPNEKSDIHAMFDGREDTAWESAPIKWNESNPVFIIDTGKQQRMTGLEIKAQNPTDKPAFLRIYCSDYPDMFSDAAIYEGRVTYETDGITAHTIQCREAYGRYLRIEVLAIEAKRNEEYRLSIAAMKVVR